MTGMQLVYAQIMRVFFQQDANKVTITDSISIRVHYKVWIDEVVIGTTLLSTVDHEAVAS